MSAGVEFLTSTTAPRVRFGPATWRGMWAMAWADFQERTRQPGQLIALLVMAWLTHGMLPPQRAGYRTFTMIDGYRPAYGPEWVGVLVAMLTSVYFLFVGFYLVRGRVERDRRNGVGQVLAATPVTSLGYLASKALSNALVLGSMMLVAMLVALASQQLLGEDRRIDLLAIGLPFLLLTGPVVLFVSAAAVCFDCLPGLRSGVGNIVWFFLLAAILSGTALESSAQNRAILDLVGGRTVSDVAYRDLHAAYPATRGDQRSLSMGVNASPAWKGRAMQTFRWNGMAWSPAMLGVRLFWIVVAGVLVGIAARMFDRFEGVRLHGRPRRAAPFARVEQWLHRRAPSSAPARVRAASLTVAPRTFAFANLLGAELTLLAKGMPAWWFLGAIGFMIAGAFAPMSALRGAWLPVASFWPVFVWSTLGSREKQFETAGLFFSVAAPVRRMLPAAWLSGTLVMLVIGATGVLRLGLAGDAASVAGWVLGAATVSALALSLGVWTGSGTFFEVFYLFLWYIGPMHHVAEFDYTGVTVARSSALWVVYGALTLVLFGAAWVGRTRQLQR